MQNDKSKFKNEFINRVYRFALETIRVVETCPKDNAANIIVNQLLRSSTSIGANVAEAQASSSKRDYLNYFTNALKSANETKYWVRLLKDAGKVEPNPADKLLKEVGEIANILASSVLTMKGKK